MDDHTTTMHIRRRAMGDAGLVWMLTIVHHPDRDRVGTARPLPRQGRLILGRGATTALPRALDAEGVSREHASIERDGDDIVATDLGSKNGTWLAGALITRAALADGAVLRLGACLVRVHKGRPRVTRCDAEGYGLVGISDAMAALRKEIATVGRHPTSVMVLGETGVGKELVVRALHAHSGRQGELVPVNCGALSDELVTSAIFGHVRGAFTGAVRDKDGLIHAARGGTLVLDELGDASPRLQAALLRAIEEGRYRPVGATGTRPADVRWLAAAQPIIEARVAEGGFRLDLWTRLARWVLRAPALRDRPEDIPLLAATFADEIAPGAGLTAELALVLMKRPWPGNVRGLRSAVERIVVSAEGASLLDVQPWLLEAPPAPPARIAPAHAMADDDATTVQAERPRRAPRPCPPREELIGQLETHEGNVKRVAAALDVGRRTLYRWIEQHALDPGDFRG